MVRDFCGVELEHTKRSFGLSNRCSAVSVSVSVSGAGAGSGAESLLPHDILYEPNFEILLPVV